MLLYTTLHLQFLRGIGRLSKEEIEEMITDAEKYKEEDVWERERISAKNALESYAYNMKSNMDNEEIKYSIHSWTWWEDNKIMDKCKDVLDWLDCNQVSGKPKPF